MNSISVLQRADVRKKAALGLLCFALALTLLSSSYRLLAIIAAPAKKAQLFESKLESLHRGGLPTGSLGFVGAGKANLGDYYYAQYVLSPRVLRSDANAKFVLCRIHGAKLRENAHRLRRLDSWIENRFS